MIKLVAFDWNGTILSDTIQTLKGDNASLAVHGIEPITIKQFRQYFDVPITNFYANLGISKETVMEKIDETENAFHDTYEELAKKARTRSGARELLTYLKKNNIESIIFSNHLKDKVEEQLVRLKIANYFNHVIANSARGDTVKRRYKGDALKSYIKKKNLNAKEVITVGDTIEEIEIAKELGTISIALTHGFNSTRRLKEKKPDYLLGDLRQIKKIIETINQ